MIISGRRGDDDGGGGGKSQKNMVLPVAMVGLGNVASRLSSSGIVAEEQREQFPRHYSM